MLSALPNTTYAGTYSPKLNKLPKEHGDGGKTHIGQHLSTNKNQTLSCINWEEQALEYSMHYLTRLLNQEEMTQGWEGGVGLDYEDSQARFYKLSQHIAHATPQDPYPRINNM